MLWLDIWLEGLGSLGAGVDLVTRISKRILLDNFFAAELPALLTLVLMRHRF